MATNSADALGAGHANAPRAVRRSTFFFWMSLVVLAVVLAGFGRTLFLRAFYPVPALPAYVFAHGVVMAAWCSLLVIQTSLIAAHRNDLHRYLGIAGTTLAAAMVVFGLLTILRFPHHYSISHGTGTNGMPQPPFAVAVEILWGDLGVLAGFAALVATGISLRRRPAAHKRLMLLSAMFIIGPSLGRFANIPMLWGDAVPSPFLDSFSGYAEYLVLFSLVVFDLFTTRRVHWASAAGLVVYLGVDWLDHSPLAGTTVGQALWDALK